MNLSPFPSMNIHEYWVSVCVHQQQTVTMGDNPPSMSSSSHPSILSFISAVLCHHPTIDLLTLEQFSIGLSLPFPTYRIDTTE